MSGFVLRGNVLGCNITGPQKTTPSTDLCGSGQSAYVFKLVQNKWIRVDYIVNPMEPEPTEKKILS
jgi:hypothetical protein